MCLGFVAAVLAWQIKADALEKGDLGLVAEKSTKSQKTLNFGQKIPPLSAREVRRALAVLSQTHLVVMVVVVVVVVDDGVPIA